MQRQRQGQRQIDSVRVGAGHGNKPMNSIIVSTVLGFRVNVLAQKNTNNVVWYGSIRLRTPVLRHSPFESVGLGSYGHFHVGYPGKDVCSC